MTLRCEQCGHENDSRYRFCGMCGARLPLPPREMSPPPADAFVPAPQPKPVSGPSFLGLADDPSDQASYLLEDEPSTSHWGRYLVLTVFIAGVAATAWNWRQDLRSLASRFAGGSPATQSQETSIPAPAPPATSSLEAPASPSGAAAVVPPPAAEASNQAAPASVAPPSATPPDATQAPQAGIPAAAVPKSNSAAPATGSSVPGSQQTQAAPPAPAVASGGDSQPANSDASDSKDEAPAENNEVPHEEPPPAKPRAAAKPSRSPRDQVPVSSESEALEAQGEKYLYGTGVPANCALAKKSLLAAAERSSTKAQSVLGTMYATGHCTTRDLPLAYHWFARALHQDPSNLRIEEDLKVLWNQMSADERQLALRAER
ncbi:MAG: hypothetical protein WB952_06075 [Terriglobales bacterium]